MAPKAHGSTENMVQEDLRWGCDRELADAICSFNRKYAEQAGYWKTTDFEGQTVGQEVCVGVLGEAGFVALKRLQHLPCLLMRKSFV